MTFRWLAFAALLGIVASAGAAHPSRAADRHVDPEHGNDAHDGIAQPIHTIARAIKLTEPGDTIHLKPMVYRDQAAFFNKAGTADRPITLDGHGATLHGCDPLDPSGWTEVEPGLFRNADLIPLTEAIIDRWFFVMDGKPNRMNRCSKGPSEPLKTPEALQPGEWTFVKDDERSRTARTGYIHGTFWLKLAPGQPLADAQIEVPVRMAGVSMHGRCAHLIVRNLTSVRPYNDGFNLSNCEDVVLENIRAVECGDDGISAHGHCRYQVEGFTSIGNATGICDTGNSRTSYRNVFIADCIGFDLYFLDTGHYTVRNARIRSAAARPLYLQGRTAPAGSCTVTLENVWLERTGGPAEVRVSPGCRLTATRCTVTGVDWQATGGEISLTKCVVGGSVAGTGGKPRGPALHLWPAARWHGAGNRYGFSSIRVADRTFPVTDFAAFRELTNSDHNSQWAPAAPAEEPGIGVDRQLLPRPASRTP